MSAPRKGGYGWVANLADANFIITDFHMALEALLRRPDTPPAHQEMYRRLLKTFPRLRRSLEELERIGQESKAERGVDFTALREAIAGAIAVHKEMEGIISGEEPPPRSVMSFCARLWKASIVQIITAVGMEDEFTFDPEQVEP